MPIEYTTSLDGVEPAHLDGFFEGWPSPPSPARHVEILEGSYRVVLAREAGSPQVIGFANAVSDGHLSGFIPLLEVLPGHRGEGIGTELVRRLLAELDDLYSVDLVCDEASATSRSSTAATASASRETSPGSSAS